MTRDAVIKNTLGILVCSCCIWSETLNVGRCPLSAYIDKTRLCTSKFIRELQANSSADCSALYDDMIKCIKDIVRICLRGYISDSAIETHLKESAKKLKTKEFYCGSANYQPQILSDLQKKRLPCVEEFFTESPKCTEELKSKFKTNPADPTLCSEFLRAKSCMKSLLEKYCVLDQRTQSIMSHAFDDYNPFCKVTFVGSTTEPFPVTNEDSRLVVPITEEDARLVVPGYKAETNQVLGPCSFLAQLNRTRACTTYFVKSYQADPLGNCSAKFITMLKCITCVIRSCLKDYYNESEIEQRLKESVNTRTESFYCGGMVEVSYVRTPDSPSVCDQSYVNNAATCLRNFNNAFGSNISSPKLCSNFTEAKSCLRKVIKEDCPHSDGQHSVTLEYPFILDDYNPFCDGNQDLPNGKEPLSPPTANITYVEPCVKENTVITRKRTSDGCQVNLNTAVVSGVLLGIIKQLQAEETITLL